MTLTVDIPVIPLAPAAARRAIEGLSDRSRTTSCPTSSCSSPS
jgi:hypothetical protein